MADHSIILPRERWQDRLIIRTDDPAEHARLAALVANGIPDFHGIHDVELPKTAAEISLLGEVLTAINVYRTLLKLEPISFHVDRCHLLSPEDWEARIVPTTPGASAQAVYGHCYLPRTDSLLQLAKLMTHEMAHATSYLMIEIIPVPNGKPKLKLRRTGFAFMGGRNDEAMFTGFNEGVTELMAHNLRAIMARSTAQLLTPEELQDLTSSIIYYPQFRLIEGLLTRDGASKADPQPLRRLMTDYLTGSWSFCRSLLPTWPQANRLLREMGCGERDALWVAQSLGLTHTWQQIHEVLVAQA
jgi:hypothetical protein